MFEKEYTIRYSEVTQNSTASLSALVSYLQDTTMFHSDSVGQGINDLMGQHMAWLLASWHIKVIRYPRYAEKIRARTWATKFTGVYGYRDFEIVDENDNIITIASSAWILYNAEAQKMCRVTQEIADVYAPEPRFIFGSEEARIRPPKEYEDVCKCVVCRRDLDTNNHVNNIHYIDFALDALPPDMTVHEIRIGYKRAAVFGDCITVGIHKEPDGLHTCVLHDEAGNIYTILQFS